jgi:hypothetical protein
MRLAGGSSDRRQCADVARAVLALSVQAVFDVAQRAVQVSVLFVAPLHLAAVKPLHDRIADANASVAVLVVLAHRVVPCLVVSWPPAPVPAGGGGVMYRPHSPHLGGHSPQPWIGQSSSGSSPTTEQRHVRSRAQTCRTTESRTSDPTSLRFMSASLFFGLVDCGISPLPHLSLPLAIWLSRQPSPDFLRYLKPLHQPAMVCLAEHCL